MTGSTHVDSHSHIFNAEDLPIDGFVKKLSPVPRLLTGLLSVPLDRLTAWAAPGSGEADHLLDLLRGASGREAAGGIVTDVKSDLISDEEIDLLLIQHLGTGRNGPVREGPRAVDDAVAARLVELSMEEVFELESWLQEWGDPELERELATREAQLEGLRDVVSWAGSRSKVLRRALKRYVEALRLITRYRYQIAADLAQTYPSVSLFTPALVDFSYTASDRPSTRVPAQIAVHSLVSKLSIVGGIPDAPDARFHPFVGFCPHREVATTELKHWNIDAGQENRYVPYAEPTSAERVDRYHPSLRFDRDRAKTLSGPSGDWHTAKLELDHLERSLDLVRHAVELGGFTGVKIYPPAGFLPLGNTARFGERRGQQLDAALRALYAYCVAMDVPILTHASPSNGFDDGFDDLASPAGWELPLAEYPDLRVCFGHFGHLHGEAGDGSAAGNGSFGWPSRFVRLIDRHPNVYADVGNSKFAVSDEYRKRFIPVLQALLGPAGTTDPQFLKRRKRVMFGTDYWMNTLSPEHRAYHTVFDGAMKTHFDGELRPWFMGENGLRFLGIIDDAGQFDPTNANRQRLIDFYGPNPKPAWLA